MHLHVHVAHGMSLWHVCAPTHPHLLLVFLPVQVLDGVTPQVQFVKVVSDELVELMGSAGSKELEAGSPQIILMAGLQVRTNRAAAAAAAATVRAATPVARAVEGVAAAVRCGLARARAVSNSSSSSSRRSVNGMLWSCLLICQQPSAYGTSLFHLPHVCRAGSWEDHCLWQARSVLEEAPEEGPAGGNRHLQVSSSNNSSSWHTCSSSSREQQQQQGGWMLGSVQQPEVCPCSQFATQMSSMVLGLID
jgi:hypothetical protein